MGSFIYYISKKNIHDEKIMIIRLVLCLGTFFTLIFNNAVLITGQMNNYRAELNDLFFKRISLFNLCPPVYAKYISIIIIIIAITGYFPKITCLAHAWVCLSITNSFISIDGGDQIAANLSILLIPICLLDNRINQWNHVRKNNDYANIFSNLTFYVIQLQASIIYLQAAIGKLFTNSWREGIATYFWLSNPVMGAPNWLSHLYDVITLSKWVTLLSWGVIIFEIALFACIFAPKRIKQLFLLPAIIFHFLIIMTFGLFSFFFSITAIIIAYLDDSNQTILIFNKVKTQYQNGKKRFFRT